MLPAATYIRKRNQKHKHYDFEYLRKRDGVKTFLCMKSVVYTRISYHYTSIAIRKMRIAYTYVWYFFFIADRTQHTHTFANKEKKKLLAQVDVTLVEYTFFMHIRYRIAVYFTYMHYSLSLCTDCVS